MPERHAIREIRRKAMLLAVLGIFLSGILVAVVTAVPMYQSARDGLERSTLMGLQAQGPRWTTWCSATKGLPAR